MCIEAMQTEITRPLLSVVIPCFNEAGTILDLIERVREAPFASKQLIVVDDGSSDGPRELSKGLRGFDLTVLLHERNNGKGGRASNCIYSSSW